MGDIEQQLREAMHSADADEQPPGNLVETIRRRNRRHTIRVAGMGAVVAAALSAAVAIAVTHSSQAPGLGPVSSPPAPTPTPRAVPGTGLLTCGSAIYGDLGPDWHKRSVRAGPLWFVGARDLASTDRSTNPLGNYRRGYGMIIEVDPNTTVWVTVPAKARPYFWFGGSGTSASRTYGMTFVSCPAVPASPEMQVAPDGTTQFETGITVAAPRCVPLDVWTSARTRPVRVTLSFGAGACPTGK